MKLGKLVWVCQVIDQLVKRYADLRLVQVRQGVKRDVRLCAVHEGGTSFVEVWAGVAVHDCGS